jgi:hypothetical protein
MWYWKTLFLVLFTASIAFSQDSDQKITSDEDDEDIQYEVEQLGTITFTVGVKIKGKFEKPQVIIFLPKGKSQFREMDFSYSFKKDIYKSLPFKPIKE